MARAGRFGTKGLAITFLAADGTLAAEEARVLQEVQDRFEVKITEMPDEIDLASYMEQR